jgi:protein subunit release factor B
MLFSKLLPLLFISPSLHRSHALNGLILCRGLAVAKKPEDVNPKKIEIVIKEEDLVEKFIRGSGPGGQNINKTSSKVQLTHVPSGITISSQETRDLSANRKIARRKLTEQLDLLYNGKESKIFKKQEKIRRRKSRARRRANKKYGVGEAGKTIDGEESGDGVDDDDDEEDSSIEESHHIATDSLPTKLS